MHTLYELYTALLLMPASTPKSLVENRRHTTDLATAQTSFRSFGLYFILIYLLFISPLILISVFILLLSLDPYTVLLCVCYEAGNVLYIYLNINGDENFASSYKIS